MTRTTERTRLLPNEGKPQYVFYTSIARERQRRVKQFQCCLCVIFISTLIVIFVATIAYSISKTNEIINAANKTNTDIITTFLTKSWPLLDRIQDEKNCNNETEWNNAMANGQKALQRKNELDKNITSLPLNSPSYKHQKVFVNTQKTRKLSEIGYQQEFARRYFAKNATKICNKNYSNHCIHTLHQCNSLQKYRSYNGTCNNLIYSNEYGVAYRPFRRALPPDYADGISKPRVGRDGKSLPSARTVSLEVHRPYFKDDYKFSVVLAVWGQFLDHDMTATALSQGINGTTISCCLNTNVTVPECFPVKLDPFDPYVRHNLTCMEFVRSAPAPTCCLGPREQMNQATAFIDASVIYSVDDDIVMKLRSMQGGELQMYKTEDNRTLLPISNDLNDGCNKKQENDKGRYCFLTGDPRANENLHLTTMHLIWARQHNLIAKNLVLLNPHWTDEQVFQEARKIVGAQIQHITYQEFLPVLLGIELMEKFNLLPQTSGYFMHYNHNVDPSIANNFATAAFRFAHSIIPGLMKFLANDSSNPEFIQLHKILFDPFKLYQPETLDRAIRGAMDTTIEANDPYFTDELKNHLFEDDSENTTKLCGLDLVSLNIQRGRDHGLVGYNSWREHCGLRRVRTFEQLRGDINDESLRNIQSVYRDVEDIDLYTGALSEKPINGSILGPTLTCLILDQFIRTKIGDRFWYENPNMFTLQQLNEIRKTSLATIICENSDNVDTVQPFIMEKIRNDNPMTHCSELPKPRWNPWKESISRVPLSDGKMSVKTASQN